MEEEEASKQELAEEWLLERVSTWPGIPVKDLFQGKPQTVTWREVRAVYRDLVSQSRIAYIQWGPSRHHFDPTRFHVHVLRLVDGLQEKAAAELVDYFWRQGHPVTVTQAEQALAGVANRNTIGKRISELLLAGVLVKAPCGPADTRKRCHALAEETRQSIRGLLNDIRLGVINGTYLPDLPDGTERSCA